MKNSYTVSKTFRESYTGGEIGWEDQSQCILCPTDSKLNLINKNTGLVVTSLNEADEKILSCCGSQGKIAIAYESEQIFVYTLTDEIWSVAVKLKCKQVQHMDFSADGKLLAVASSDSTVKVFSVVGGYCTHNFLGSRGIVGRVYFDPNPAHYILFSIDQECDIRMWDLVKKECVGVLSGHDSSVTCLAIIDGNLISSARDKVLNVWNLKSKKLEKSIAIFEEVESIFTITRETSTGKNETLLVTAGRKGVLRLWDVKEGKQLYSFDPFRKRTIDPTKAQLEESYIDYIVYLGDDHVAVANRAQMIAIVDISTKPFQTIRTIVGWNDSILDLCFLKYPKRIGANSSFLAVAANAPSLRVLNTESNSWTVIPDAHEGNILKLALSFDREWLATSSSDGVVKVWKVVHSEDQEAIKFEFAAYAASHLDACSALQWSQKSNSFLISASADTTMKMWDTEPLKDWQVGQRPINMVSCCALKAHDKEVNCAKVSPNDKFLATASQDKTIKLWKITKKSPFLSDPVTFSGHKRGVWGCAFSPVDKLLASCSTDQTIKLWSLDNATCLRTLQGHSGSVLCVEFICPLGSQLLSSGADGVLKLWNIKEGECVNSFTNHDEKIWVINAVPDTQTCELVTGGADSIITYWKDNTKEIEAKKIEEQHKIVEGNQQLTNLIATRNYKEAARLAITLNHPRKLYFIFETCFQNDKPAFKPLIESLRQEDLVYTILKIRDWNTHSKTAVLSQEILYVIFTLYTPTSLAKLPLMKQALQGLIPYTERHLTHLDTTIQESFIIDFTLFEMKRY